MKKIKLTKKESDKILSNLKKSGILRIQKGKPLKHIIFHNEFEKGWRLALCHKCGYPHKFMGLNLFNKCEMCNSNNIHIYNLKDNNTYFWFYNLKDLDKFIIKIQQIYQKRKKNKKQGKQL